MRVFRRSRRFAVGAGFALALACSSDPAQPNPNPGPDTTPASIGASSGNGQTATVGAVLSNPFVVTVANAAGAPLEGVTIQWTVQSGGGSLSASSNTTNAQGQASTIYTLGAAAGVQTVRAAITGTSLERAFTVTATPPPADPTPASITIAGGSDGQSGTVGEQLPNPLEVMVRNAGGTPLSGVTITWTVTQGGGSVGSPTSVTNSVGVASTTYTLGPTAGTNTIDAAVQSNPSLMQTFMATANAPPAAASVSVMDNFFNPTSVTIAASGTVTWTWNGGVQHNVTSVGGTFTNSGDQGNGFVHQVTFNTAGTYNYLCSIHGASMSGTVVVK